jgi:hypothetical protein
MQATDIEKLEYIRYVLHTIQDDKPEAPTFVYTDFINREDVPSAALWTEEQPEAIKLASQFAYELLESSVPPFAEMSDLQLARHINGAYTKNKTRSQWNADFEEVLKEVRTDRAAALKKHLQ